MTQMLNEKVSLSLVSADESLTSKGHFCFYPRQAEILHQYSMEIAQFGGPQMAGASAKADIAATEIKLMLAPSQNRTLSLFANGGLATIFFNELLGMDELKIPIELPHIEELKYSQETLYLASRNQILLKLIDHHAFAYDFDNNGEITRLVGNFKGGGLNKIKNEANQVELSSHSGLALGPHTEAPYWCSVRSDGTHSPAPSSLILTAMYNPRGEPTRVIPIKPILELIGPINTLALTTKNFNFTRSDSFLTGTGAAGRNVSMIEFDQDLGFVIRFNAYRFSINETAPHGVKSAFNAFQMVLSQTSPTGYNLNQTNALVINNDIALHCRDVIQDNRRLLVRLFGRSRNAKMLPISPDPLIVTGG